MAISGTSTAGKVGEGQTNVPEPANTQDGEGSQSEQLSDMKVDEDDEYTMEEINSLR
jgi:hypothetical protein